MTRRKIRETTRMSYKSKRPRKFKYILARVGNKFSRRIYLQTRSDIQGMFRGMYESIFENDCEKCPDEKKTKTFTGQIQGGRTWKICKFYSTEAAQWSDVSRNYPNTNENIWGTKFTVEYSLAMSESYKKGWWRLHNFRQYS